MKKFRKHIFLLLFVYTTFIVNIQQVKGQNSPNLKEQILNYLLTLQSNPDEITLIENRLGYEIKDPDGFLLLKTLLKEKIAQNPEQKVFVELLSWQYIQSKDFDRAIIEETALNKIENGNGLRLLNLGRLCYHNQSYIQAIKCFEYIIQLGKDNSHYRQAKNELILCNELEIFDTPHKMEEFIKLKSSMESFINEFKAGDDVDELKVHLAKLEIENLNQAQEAKKIMVSLLTQPSISPLLKSNCKMTLAQADIFLGLVWEAALLYNQIFVDFKEEPMGQEALLNASKLYYYAGDFKLAKSRLDVLKTATSELTANDALALSLLIQKNLEEDSLGTALKAFAKAELLIYQHRSKEALETLDTVSKHFPNNSLGEDIFMARYEIDFYERQFLNAAKNLEDLIAHYPEGILVDKALFLLAELNEKTLVNKTKAGELYEKLFLTYPGSFYATEARKRFRFLRGDRLDG